MSRFESLRAYRKNPNPLKSNAFTAPRGNESGACEINGLCGEVPHESVVIPVEVMDWPAMSDDASPISGWWLPPAVVIGLAGLAALVWWGW